MDSNYKEMIQAILNADPDHLDELFNELGPDETWVVLNKFVSSGPATALENGTKCIRRSGRNSVLHDATFVQGDDDLDQFDGQTLLHIAADLSRAKCVRVILSHVESTEQRKALCNLKEQTVYKRIPLHTVLDGGCRCSACTMNNVECVTTLLAEGSDVNGKDAEGDSPLVYAVEHMMAECASLLLEHGADASLKFIKWSSRKSAQPKSIKLYEYIAQKIPSALTALLDKGVSLQKDDSSILDLDYKVFLQTDEKTQGNNYNSITMDDVVYSTRENEILTCMSKAHSKGRELLLTHPMTLSFLHFKWSLVRRYVGVIQFLYFVMTILYTLYTIEAFQSFRTEDDGEDAEETEFEQQKGYRLTMTILVCIWWVAMILNEFYEVSLGLRKYLKVGLNYAWWVLIITVGISIPPGFDVEPKLWQLPIASFSVFLAWGLTLVQTSRFPSLGIYVEMLGKVVTDFAIFVVTFAALLIGFALAFHILFPHDEMFSNIGTSFVKVILIMIGESDYEGIFEDVVDPDVELLPLEFNISAHIIYVGFIFVITIVVMNLLLGLAVSDIQELRKVATVLRVRRQIEQIELFESLLIKLLPGKISIWAAKKFSIMNILASEQAGGSTTSIEISPTNPEDKTLPKDLKELFIPFVTQTTCLNPSISKVIKYSSVNVREMFKSKVKGFSRKDKTEVGVRIGQLEDRLTQVQEVLVSLQASLVKIENKLESLN